MKPTLLKLLLILFFLSGFLTNSSQAQAADEERLYGVGEAVFAVGGKFSAGCPCPLNPVTKEADCSKFPDFEPFCKTDVDECSEDPELGSYFASCGKENQSVGASLGVGIASIYQNRPAGTDIYLADLLHNINPAIQPAYAQGIGFTSLTPVLPIWKVFRNLAYMLYIFIFIIVGFAIMFRAKLNPQTVVSIEAALPGLILTLVLITFSYAISGLLIDLMYLSIFLITNLLAGLFNNGRIGGITLQDYALSNNVFHHGFGLFGNNAVLNMSQSVGDMIFQLFNPTGGSGFWESILSTVLGFFVGLIAWAVIGILIIFNVFKVFIMLLGSYIQIIFYVIFSPLILLGNALPGSNAFVGWLKNIAAHLAVFPIVITMFLITYALTGTDTNNVGYQPGSNAGFTPPLLLGGSTNAIQGLLALGVIMFMPKALELAKSAFGIDSRGGGGGLFGGIASGIPGLATLQSGVQTAAGARAAHVLGLGANRLGSAARGVAGDAYNTVTRPVQAGQRLQSQAAGLRDRAAGVASAVLNPRRTVSNQVNKFTANRRAELAEFERKRNYAESNPTTTLKPGDDAPIPPQRQGGSIPGRKKLNNN